MGLEKYPSWGLDMQIGSGEWIIYTDEQGNDWYLKSLMSDPPRTTHGKLQV